MGGIIAALIWASLAHVFGRSERERYLGLAAIWLLGCLAASLPGLGGLNRILGGDAQFWLILGLFGTLALVYAKGISWLRQKARARHLAAAPLPAPPPAPGAFSEEELDRYARHILLREIGGPGQQRLRAARVLVVGAGGLGAPALMYLAAAGVGEIGIVDDDRVEASNLQRQIIHSGARIGMEKTRSAAIAIEALNPHVTVRPYAFRLDASNARELVAAHDLVLDGSDNFDTRYLVNETCAALGKPLIAAAITQWEGQISLFHPAAGGPCYACVFPERPLPGMVPTCAEAGVAAPLPGILGAMMAMEAVKWITGAGESLAGRLVIHDALYGETRAITARPRPGCPVCGGAKA